MDMTYLPASVTQRALSDGNPPSVQWLVAIAIACSLGTPAAVIAHGDETHADSPAADWLQDLAGDSPSNNTPRMAAVESQPIRGAAPANLPGVLGGQWSPVYDWPLVAVHAALLPNGKVLAWDATPDDADDDPHTTDNFTTRVTLWDPLANTHVSTNNDTDTDLFCAGSAHLWDGRILFAGGDSGRAGANGPLSNSNIYDFRTNTWRRTENMNTPRWYSSVAALANGEMLTMGGSYSPSPIAEVFQFNQSWRPLNNVTTPFDFGGEYQWLQATPEGRVISFGPKNLVATIDPAGDGAWQSGPPRDDVTERDYGSYAMYTTGKILVAGGANSVNSSVVIDTNTQASQASGSLNIGRRQHNLTILADGSVLASGGNNDGTEFYSLTGGVFEPELWTPETGQWARLNPMNADRQYHSVAMLLPDGRVLSAGGGICGDCYAAGYEERNAALFAPPYLFASGDDRAPRPGLGAVPETADYGQTISVAVDDVSRIAKAHLIKIGSVTHSQNQDQRLVPLEYSGVGQSMQLTLPASRNVAPPGHYLLFVVDADGVPSIGAMMRLGQPLVEPGQVVNSTLGANSWDNYAVPAGSADLQMTLSSSLPTALFVSRNGAVSSSTQAGLVCRQSQPANQQTCSIPAGSGDVLHVAINGAQNTDYALTIRQAGGVVAPPNRPEPVDPVDLPSDNNEGGTPVNTPPTAPEDPPPATDGVTGSIRTGGLTGPALLLVLALAGFFRRRCHLQPSLR